LQAPATSRCVGGHYKTGALFDVWEGWPDVESKFKAVAALCDNAYYASKGKFKKAKYLPGWFIARRIIQPYIFDHVVCYVRPHNMVSGVVWIEKCRQWLPDRREATRTLSHPD